MVFEKSEKLLETYHGVNISIEYYIRGKVKRLGLLSQNIVTTQMEIYASSRPQQGIVSTKAREFLMTPESVTIQGDNFDIAQVHAFLKGRFFEWAQFLA